MPETLEGIRVLDLSRVLAGPWCAQCLGDLGAEVIKVERPGTGDDTRHWGPPFLQMETGEGPGESAYFQSANRGKRSITVNLADPDGQQIIRELAGQSDVLVENYRVGGLARFGLDYESLSAVNPRLIYCSITGFGQTGPARMRPGYDFMIQAEGGLMSLTGEADDRPGGGPTKTGLAVSDLFTGMYAVQAVLAAILERGRSGQGQHIDLALLDSTIAGLSMMAISGLITGTSPPRLGNAHPHVVPYRLYPTADRPMVVAVGNNAQFARFATAIELPHLAADPRFATNRDRLQHREVLDGLIENQMRNQPFSHWDAALTAADIPFAPVNTVLDALNLEQTRARGMRIELPHANGGTVPSPGNPIRLSRTPVRYRGAAPALGGDTESILRDVLGKSHQEVKRLRAGGSI
ncbi:MAG: CoA transferase [Rhodospirillales bacterium]|nr:CoA transferase [Rhodospirillales bacterium]